jgi:hypothetical protein
MEKLKSHSIWFDGLPIKFPCTRHFSSAFPAIYKNYSLLFMSGSDSRAIKKLIRRNEIQINDSIRHATLDKEKVNLPGFLFALSFLVVSFAWGWASFPSKGFGFNVVKLGGKLKKIQELVVWDWSQILQGFF